MQTTPQAHVALILIVLKYKRLSFFLLKSYSTIQQLTSFSGERENTSTGNEVARRVDLDLTMMLLVTKRRCTTIANEAKEAFLLKVACYSYEGFRLTKGMVSLICRSGRLIHTVLLKLSTV